MAEQHQIPCACTLPKQLPDELFVCYSSNCPASPFLCSEQRCMCYSPHKGHSIIRLSRFFIRARNAEQYNDSLQRASTRLDRSIDGLLSSLKTFGGMLQAWCRQISFSLQQSASIFKKLQEGTVPSSIKATSSLFHSIMSTQEPETYRQRRSIEKLNDQLAELIAQLQAITDSMGFYSKSQPAFLFSEELKHSDIQLKQDGRYATIGQCLGMILLQPAIDSPYKVSFKIGTMDECSSISLGICSSHQQVKARQYTVYDRDPNWLRMMNSSGYLYQYGQHGFKFGQGSRITVEYDPIRRVVTYSSPNATEVIQEVPVEFYGSQPIHFCVNMGRGWGSRGCALQII